MTLRSDLRTEIARRLGDSGNVIWTTADLNGYIGKAITGLYPSYYRRQSDTTTAGAGPIQTAPTGARNLYYIGQQRASSTRVRLVRGWTEGEGEAVIPKTGITGDTLVWSWTTGFTEPTDDVTALDIPPEAEELVVLRSMIAALERILTDRVSQEKFYSLAVREGVNEDDIVNTLDALHQSVARRIANLPPLPEIHN